MILCRTPVSAAVSLGWKDDSYFQIVAAPLLVLFLLFWDRDRIFRGAAWNTRVGVPLLVLAVAIYLFLHSVAGVILVAMAAFILGFGLRSFRAACFPLGCLLLMIPLPASAMERIIHSLQQGSASVSYQMLRLTGIPVFADGMRISLKGLEIEVAPECSGIRSCAALALVGLLAGRVCLRSGWHRLALVVSTIPIAIFKNAIRISVLASLGAYVNPAFLHGNLHHYGGLVFTPLGIGIFVALVAGLIRYEAWQAGRHENRNVPAPSDAPVKA